MTEVRDQEGKGKEGITRSYVIHPGRDKLHLRGYGFYPTTTRRRLKLVSFSLPVSHPLTFVVTVVKSLEMEMLALSSGRPSPPWVARN